MAADKNRIWLAEIPGRTLAIALIPAPNRKTAEQKLRKREDVGFIDCKNVWSGIGKIIREDKRHGKGTNDE